MDRTGPACSRNSRTWIRCMAKCVSILACASCFLAALWRHQPMGLGNSCCWGQPLCPTLGWKPLAHSPRRASSRLGPVGPSSQKEMQANHAATKSWTSLDDFESVEFMETCQTCCVSYHIKMEDFGTHRLPLELVVFSRASLPNQVLSLQTSLLAKLPGRGLPPSLFSFSASILGSHIMSINVMNVIIMCVCKCIMCLLCF